MSEKGKEKKASSSRPKTPSLPPPILNTSPIKPENLVNRYQILGEIPKPFSTVLASQPRPVLPSQFVGSPSKPVRPSYPKPDKVEDLPRLPPGPTYSLRPGALDPFDICDPNPSVNPNAKHAIKPSEPSPQPIKQIDPFASSPKPIRSQGPFIKHPTQRSEYVLRSTSNLFYVDTSFSHKTDPIKLAQQYYPDGWHFQPQSPEKNLMYYKDILLDTNSASFKPIFDTKDPSKLIFHSIYIIRIISMSEWGKLATLRGNPNLQYTYYDYMEAFFKVFLYQKDDFSHSWFINFDRYFNGKFPTWFIRWWDQHGLTIDLLPEPLHAWMVYYQTHAPPNQQSTYVPLLLAFMSKYKIPYILKWQYALSSAESKVVHMAGPSTVLATHCKGIDLVTRKYFIKWWDNFQCSKIETYVKEDKTLLKHAPVKPIKAPVTPITKPEVPSSFPDMDECSSKDLKLMVQALQEQLSQRDRDFIKPESPSRSQESTASSSTSQRVYIGEEFQDAQDPYAS